MAKKSKPSAKRAAPAKKDAPAPAKKQTAKKATKKATKKSSRPPAAEKATAKAAAPAKQEAPARAAAPVKPSKKAASKPAAAGKKASKKAAAKTDVAPPSPAPTPAPIKKATKKTSKTDVAPPSPAPTPAPVIKKSAKKTAKTDVAPPSPAPTPTPVKKSAKKATKTDVAPPSPAPAPAAAPSKAAPKKRAAKKAAAKPEVTDDDDDDGRAPAAARTGGAQAPAFRGFGPGLFEFFADLAMNNDRAWFEANKRRYETEVREPALAFIRAMGSRLAELSKHFVASDQKVGGSLMRIHRDTRFSPDKTPYKTNLGVQFRHAAGKDVHAPGLYVHADGEGVFIASGTWHPEPEPLAAIRNAIAERPNAWKKARDDAGFRKHWALEGESLSRPPRGFDKEHPFVDDLRRKDHIAVCRLDAKELTRADMVDRITERFLASAPYLRFLCEAIGVSF